MSKHYIAEMTSVLLLVYQLYANTHFQQTHLWKVKSMRGIYGSTCTQSIAYLSVLQEQFLNCM